RDDARGGEFEFHRVLAVRSAAGAADRRHGRNFRHCYRCGRSRGRSCHGHRGLSSFPHHQRRSARSTQRMNSWITSNVWLIPAAPILAALLILAFGKAARRAAAPFAVIGQLTVLTMSIFGSAPPLCCSFLSCWNWSDSRLTCLSVSGLSGQALRPRQRKRSSPHESATWDFFSASCGSITGAAHYFFMMAGEVVLKMLVCSRSAPVRRLSRC